MYRPANAGRYFVESGRLGFAAHTTHMEKTK